MAKNCFPCKTCGRQFTTKGRLTKHSRLHVTEKPHACDVCNKQFTHKSHLDRHSRIHTGDKPYECEVCNKQFNLKGTLQRHSRIHTGDKPYACKVCEKEFARLSNLHQHSRIHKRSAVEKPYECQVCNKRFGEKGSLSMHMRFHSDEKPHVCEVCNKQFTLKSTLKEHFRIHTGEKPYVCDVCNKRFTLKSTLNKHYRIHTGETPYACEVCNMRFSRKSSLDQHSRVHTGETPYVCEVCNMRFSQKGNLDQHSRIHTGEKSYSCEVCDKRFTQKGTLNNHMKTHAGEKAFDIGNKRFVQKRNLKMHTKWKTAATDSDEVDGGSCDDDDDKTEDSVIKPAFKWKKRQFSKRKIKSPVIVKSSKKNTVTKTTEVCVKKDESSSDDEDESTDSVVKDVSKMKKTKKASFGARTSKRKFETTKICDKECNNISEGEEESTDYSVTKDVFNRGKSQRPKRKTSYAVTRTFKRIKFEATEVCDKVDERISDTEEELSGSDVKDVSKKNRARKKSESSASTKTSNRKKFEITEVSVKEDYRISLAEKESTDSGVKNVSKIKKNKGSKMKTESSAVTETFKRKKFEATGVCDEVDERISDTDEELTDSIAKVSKMEKKVSKMKTESSAVTETSKKKKFETTEVCDEVDYRISDKEEESTNLIAKDVPTMKEKKVASTKTESSAHRTSENRRFEITEVCDEVDYRISDSEEKLTDFVTDKISEVKKKKVAETKTEYSVDGTDSDELSCDEAESGASLTTKYWDGNEVSEGSCETERESTASVAKDVSISRKTQHPKANTESSVHGTDSDELSCDEEESEVSVTTKYGEKVSEGSCDTEEESISSAVQTASKMESKKRNQSRWDFEASLAILQPVVEKEKPMKEEQEVMFANSYLLRATEILKGDPEVYEKFLAILCNYHQSSGSPVELYSELQEVLTDYPALARDFVVFLRPEQAKECGRYKEHIALSKVRKFFKKIEIHFKDQPEHISQILRTFAQLREQVDLTSTEVISALRPFLENQPHLFKELNDILSSPK